jgi:ferritin-like metal-binding protein YciE
MADKQLEKQLISYLTDVHSLEQNAIAQLQTGAQQAGEPALRAAFEEHLAETQEHERLVSECLSSYGESPSTVKDLAQKGSAAITGLAAKAAPDTTGKLAIQAYAFEHMEIASYRMLSVVAERAGDQRTLEVAQRILAQEQEAASKLEELLAPVAEYDLREMGVAA